MKERFYTVFLFAGLVLVNSFGIVAQEKKSDDEVIKVETSFISVPVIVSDRNGRYVPNLTAKDFTIYDNGVKQDIEFFAATEEPLNVALLIDTSRSTAEVLDEIKDAAFDFIKLLQPQDKAMIVSFDYAPHVLSGLTDDRKQLRRAVENAEIGAEFGTTLRDALSAVVNGSFAKIKGRKAVILLTDGKDFGSDVSAENLFYSLEESDTLVYTFFYKTGRANRGGLNFPRRQGGMGRGGIFGGRFPRGGGNSSQRNERIERNNEAAEEFLQKISDTTAGRFYSGKVNDLTKTFRSIIEELRFQYRIGFYSKDEKNDDAPRQLKVKVTRPDTVVRARNSYRRKSGNESENTK